MIPLPSFDEIKSIEEKIHKIYPQSFLDYISRYSDFESPKFSKNAYFIHTIEEILNFEKLTQSSYSLLPFFIDTENGDYYCFNENSNVLVYSVHTIVHEWNDFTAWVDWSKTI